jgi:signal transduction histidine kinase
LWGAVCFVVLYRPLLHFTLYRIFSDVSPVRIYHQLHISSTKLTTTLDAAVLIEYICYGIRTTFGQPALAFYLGDIEGSNNLTCKVQERMNDLPDTIVTGPLTEQLCQLPNVTESRELHRMFSQKSYSSEEEIALFHPGIVLLCPIRHTEGFLLGLLLLGMRSDLDPYRESDIQELQRLMDSAALALTNSATYAINCRLHQRLQQERDAAAARIARELHDEIININVRLNIESLQRLAHRTNDPELRTELELMITSECALAQDLRVICEELHPTGIDDPFGLASVLLMQMDKTQANWSGTCQLIVDGTPCPITSLVQREALGIITEALTNVVKHAEATKIVVSLIYPSIEGDQVQLIIQDNGRTNQVINIKPGHWGIRGMQERAAAVGGSVQFRQVPEGGTAVVFTFPPIT